MRSSKKRVTAHASPTLISAVHIPNLWLHSHPYTGCIRIRTFLNACEPPKRPGLYDCNIGIFADGQKISIDGNQQVRLSRQGRPEYGDIPWIPARIIRHGRGLYLCGNVSNEIDNALSCAFWKCKFLEQLACYLVEYELGRE